MGAPLGFLFVSHFGPNFINVGAKMAKWWHMKKASANEN